MNLVYLWNRLALPCSDAYATAALYFILVKNYAKIRYWTHIVWKIAGVREAKRFHRKRQHQTTKANDKRRWHWSGVRERKVWNFTPKKSWREWDSKMLFKELCGKMKTSHVVFLVTFDFLLLFRPFQMVRSVHNEIFVRFFTVQE
jgi:hypothetical protein